MAASAPVVERGMKAINELPANLTIASRRARIAQVVAGGARWIFQNDEEDRREFQARRNLAPPAKYVSNHRRLRGAGYQVSQTKRGGRATQAQAAGQIASRAIETPPHEG